MCQGGQCTTDCDPGFTLCGQDCVDTDTSTTHCGGCDQPCAPGELCAAGSCTPVGVPDGGIEPDGGAADAGVSSDASPDATPLVIVRGGCYCATGSPTPGGFALALLVLLALLALGGRARRRR